MWIVYILTCIQSNENYYGYVKIVMDGIVGNRYWICCLSFKLLKYRKQNWFDDDQMTKTGVYWLMWLFYLVTSIIISNVCQINLSDGNIKNKHWCFQISKIVSPKNHFGILNYILSWKHLFEIYFRLLRRNNKQFSYEHLM
jgi:hypothetical protein